jgi:hypothetical protein
MIEVVDILIAESSAWDQDIFNKIVEKREKEQLVKFFFLPMDEFMFEPYFMNPKPAKEPLVAHVVGLNTPFFKGFVITEHIPFLKPNPKLKKFLYWENNHVESLAQTTNFKLALKMAHLLQRTLVLPLFDCTNGPTYNNPFHKNNIGKTCTAERFVDVRTLLLITRTWMLIYVSKRRKRSHVIFLL